MDDPLKLARGSSTRAPGSSGTVLHVDDSAANRHLRRRILEDAGFRVLEAQSVPEAWDILQVEQPDVVLTDVVLPGADGYELTRRIKADPSRAAIRVIQISAFFTGSEHRIRGLDSGGDSYVIEPSDSAELIAIVRAMVRGRRTERLLVRTEAALRESEERFKLMADTTPVMIWVTDASGNVEFVNRAYCEFFGVTEAEMRERHWEPLVHPEDAESYVETFRRCLTDGVPFLAETRVRRADGQWRWVASYGAPRLSPDGRVVGAVGSSPDITELKEAAERINSAMRAKDDFLASVVHELRQPITAAMSALTVMEARRNRDSGWRARDVLQRQLVQMTRLVEDLLETARVVRGEQPLRRRLVPMQEVIERAVETVTPIIAARQHTLERTAPVEPLTLDADPDRLQQVLVNMLTNAAKYTPPGGRIHVLAEREDAHVLVRVQDNGIGIAASDQAQIFDLFTRVGGAAAERGFGIGLYVARALIRQHGGEITVRSDGVGAGTEFTIRLPIAVA